MYPELGLRVAAMPTILVVAIAILGIWFYLLPWFIAFYRRHHQTGAIFLVNLLLGWTLLGWGAALIWSLLKVETERPEDRRACPHCAEQIMREAKVCRFCGRDVEPVKEPEFY